jgi:hypothetical protein
MQQAAIEVAKQQILSGQNPIELVNLLFNAKDYNQAIQQILVSPQTNSKMLQAPKPKKKKKKQQLIVK